MLLPFRIYDFVPLLSRNRSAAILVRERCVCHFIVPHPSKAIVGPTCSIGGLAKRSRLANDNGRYPWTWIFKAPRSTQERFGSGRAFPCRPAERMSPHQSGRPNPINRPRTQTNRTPKRCKNAEPVQALDPMLGAGQKFRVAGASTHESLAHEWGRTCAGIG